MSQVINLKDAGSEFQMLLQALHSSNEQCEINNEQGDTVAIILSADRFSLFRKQMERCLQRLPRCCGRP